MSAQLQDQPVDPDYRDSDQLQWESPDQDGPVEFQLEPGQRYGWWADHHKEEGRDVAMVSGAVNDLRLRILLDTGATGSMISLGLVRRLKLKTQMLPEPIKVTDLGGAPSYITASARAKITLGWRVVYILDVWLANIGEDIEVLLGMNFMYAAGVPCQTSGHHHAQ